jgi:hypothetical protein
MSIFKDQVEVYQGSSGGWYWRLRNLRSRKITADGSEQYSTASNARRAARRAGRALVLAAVVTLERASNA